MKRLQWLFAVAAVLLLLAASAGPALADTTYTVQGGDTLSSIARAHGVTVQAIVAANNITNPNFISVGQVLVIPGVSGLADVPVSSTPAAAPTAGGQTYTVQPGDSLSRIASLLGVTLQALVQLNDISNPNLIYSGQVLLVPSGATVPAASGSSATAAAPTAAAPTPAPAPTSANLLPNPSFEEDWYFFNYNELQVPSGWSLATDEGANTLEPGSGGLFLRPECRVVPAADLPPSEHHLFIFNGAKTLKCFKGGAPTSFSLYTDIQLQPGTYRFTVNFFSDAVARYNQNGSKVWATMPLAAEARIIHGSGGPGWREVTAGIKNSLTYDFTVTTPGAVRLGASFRNRWVMDNNGWFIDDWSLQRISN